MFGLGPMEICVILVVGVLLFGKRLPEVSRSIGKGLKELQSGFRDIKSEVDIDVDLKRDFKSALLPENSGGNSWEFSGNEDNQTQSSEDHDEDSSEIGDEDPALCDDYMGDQDPYTEEEEEEDLGDQPESEAVSPPETQTERQEEDGDVQARQEGDQEPKG